MILWPSMMTAQKTLSGLAWEFGRRKFAHPLTPERRKLLFDHSVRNHGIATRNYSLLSVRLYLAGALRDIAVYRGPGALDHVRRFADMALLYFKRYRVRGRVIHYNIDEESAKNDLANEPEMVQYLEEVERLLIQFHRLRLPSDDEERIGKESLRVSMAKLYATVSKLDDKINELENKVSFLLGVQHQPPALTPPTPQQTVIPVVPQTVTISPQTVTVSPQTTSSTTEKKETSIFDDPYIDDSGFRVYKFRKHFSETHQRDFYDLNAEDKTQSMGDPRMTGEDKQDYSWGDGDTLAEQYTARCILCDWIKNPQIAREMADGFAHDFLANAEDKFKLTGEKIDEWLAVNRNLQYDTWVQVRLTYWHNKGYRVATSK